MALGNFANVLRTIIKYGSLLKSGERMRAKELLQGKQAPRQQEDRNACRTI